MWTAGWLVGAKGTTKAARKVVWTVAMMAVDSVDQMAELMVAPLGS